MRCLREHSDDIGAAVALAHVDRLRQTREDIDDGQYADLATIEKLVMRVGIGFDVITGRPVPGPSPSTKFSCLSDCSTRFTKPHRWWLGGVLKWTPSLGPLGSVS
jgi:hypothetical protein